MQENKPEVILARPIDSAKETKLSIEEVVDSIMNTENQGVSELISKVTTEITDTILKESTSSVAKEDDEPIEPIVLNPENDKQFIKRVIDFLAGREFEEQCKVTGAKYNLPPKVVAKNFCLRILGTIGDVLGIAINVTRNFVKGTIQLLVSILFGGVDLICNVAQGLVSVITLNQTAQPVKA